VHAGHIGLYHAARENEKYEPVWNKYLFSNTDPHYLRPDVEVINTMIATLAPEGEQPARMIPDYVLVNAYEGWWNQQDWKAAKTKQPVYSVMFKGKPLAMIYKGDVFYEDELMLPKR